MSEEIKNWDEALQRLAHLAPTNDPTAPRVVGPHCPGCGEPCEIVRQPYTGQTHDGRPVTFDDEFSRCTKCGEDLYTFDQSMAHSEKFRAASTPAPRVVGGGERCKFCGSARHLLADCKLPGANSYRVEMSPAVLPEEGTPPPIRYPNGQLIECCGDTEGDRCSEVCPNVELLPGSLRETGAGRGEAGDGPANNIKTRVALIEEIVRILEVSSIPELRSDLARLRAASPEGGAPTEELDDDGAWLRDFTDCASEDIDPSDIKRLYAIASRLTRSPRAAGEPSDTERLAVLLWAMEAQGDKARIVDAIRSWGAGSKWTAQREKMDDVRSILDQAIWRRPSHD